MAHRLQQTISLQTKISPQQIQMIKLLELPTMQLEERIKREIEENIVLEEDAEKQSEEEGAPEKISVEEYVGKEDDTPTYKMRANNFSRDDKQRPVYITEGRSLGESLVEQLRFRSLSEEDMIIAVYIVGSIDDDGYLRRDMASLSDDLAFTRGMDVSVEELERILAIVQELEPAGIGARTLQEGLLLQMERQMLDAPYKRLAHKIISQHFESFAKKHYEKLMQRLGISAEEFREAIEYIRTLSPKPG
ncbi:MAG: RNA polymerase sigma-54 factor, partial [Alistipes sp.]|nr:RNA polymerase sigma-54 factor [Alistipes sp.]